MKKVLILGAGGFIGSNLVKALEKDYEVIKCYHYNRKEQAYSNHIYWKWPNPENKVGWSDVYVDLTNQQHVEDLFLWAQPDIVLHCSAFTTGSKDTLEQPWLHVTPNVIMNALVFEACHRHNVKHCVWFSCSVTYQQLDKPQKETDWNAGDELYPAYFGVGNMKIYSEKLCQFYSRQGTCKYTAIRHSNVYGPGDKFDLDKCHMLPALLKKVCDLPEVSAEPYKTGEYIGLKVDFPELEVWGTGVAKRDLIYVDDVVDFVRLVIQKQETPYELFNVGAGEAYSINTILETLQYVTQKSFTKKYNTSKPDIPTTVILDCTKAYQLGWEPKVSLHDGLIKTARYYEDKIKNKL